MPEIRTLGDLVNKGWVKIFTGPFGSALHKHDYTENGVSVVPAEAIVGGALDKSRFNFIGSSKGEDLGRYRLKINDVVFARRGAQACGLSALVKEEDRAQIAGTGLIYLRVLDEQAVDPYFLFLSVSDDKSVDWLKAHAVGATMPNLNGDVLRSLPVTLPSMEKQRKVSNQHRPLATKLRLNFEINKTLEQMAQALFKSWFVDFEPVKAKIAAKQRWLARQPVNEPASPVCYAPELTPGIPQYDLETTMTLAAMEVISGKDEAQLTDLQAEQPEKYAELRATAELFPSVMQDSELGEVPEGWSVPQLREQVEVLRGFSYKGKGLSDSGTPMHNLNSILEGGGYKYSGIKRYSLEFKKKFEVVPGDVLVANTEQGHAHLLIGYGAAVPSFYETSIFSHHLYRVRPKTDSYITKEFLAMLFKEPVFVKKVQGFANGTTVNMLPMAGIQMPVFVCPPKILAEKFSQLVRPYIAMTENHYLESQLLSSLRDTLLPKLLSGELTIPDAQTESQEVMA